MDSRWPQDSLPHLAHAFAKALLRTGRSPYKGEESEAEWFRKRISSLGLPTENPEAPFFYILPKGSKEEVLKNPRKSVRGTS